MGTGNSLDSCIGLVIHEKGEEWRVYKTVWEDAVAQAAELELAEAAEKKPDDTQERDKRLKKQIEELNREIDEAAKVGDNIAEKENVEKESAAEGNAAEDTAAPAASEAPQNTSEPKLLQTRLSNHPQPSHHNHPQISGCSHPQIGSPSHPQTSWPSRPQIETPSHLQTSSHSHPSLRPVHLSKAHSRKKSPLAIQKR